MPFILNSDVAAAGIPISAVLLVDLYFTRLPLNTIKEHPVGVHFNFAMSLFSLFSPSYILVPDSVIVYAV